MKFYSLLTSGMSAQIVADQFVHNMLKSSSDEGLSSSFACNFINECMKCIGFSSTVTVEELMRNAYSAEADHFDWPDIWRIYTFKYNPILSYPFENFLTYIGRIINIKTKEYVETKIANYEAITPEEENASPTQIFLEMIAMWYGAYIHLLSLDITSTSKFQEPLARINYHLLLEMNVLSKNYSRLHRLLPKVCDSLYQSAVQGIYYRNSHNMIVKGLIQLFEKNYILFYQFENNITNIFYEIFSVKYKKISHILVYKSMTEILQSYEIPPDGISNDSFVLTNRFISKNMLLVYYTHLKTEKEKKFLLALLEFVQVLQSKVLEVNCFPQPFLEAILGLVWHKDNGVSHLAVALYMEIMRRRLSPTFILLHTAEYFIYEKISSKMLHHPIRVLWIYFPEMSNLSLYATILTHTNTDVILRCCIAHIFVNVFRLMQEDIERNLSDIEQILAIIPKLLQRISCPRARGIILQLLALCPFDELKEHATSLERSLTGFENFAISEFTENSSTYDFIQLWSIFTNLYRSLRVTKNWHCLENLVTALVHSALAILQKLNEEPESAEVNESLREIFQKLSIIFSVNFTNSEIITDLYVGVSSLLLHNNLIDNCSSDHEYILVANVTQIITSHLIRAPNAENSVVEIQRKYCSEIQSFMHCLFKYLNSPEQINKRPIVVVATIFSCITSLYCEILPSRSGCSITLSINSYSSLLNTIIICNFETKAKQLNRNDFIGGKISLQRTYEYQRLMLAHFVRLHKMQHIKIPGNRVWKLCKYFGLRTHQFNDLLEAAHRVLSYVHPTIYKHIIAVIIFSLYNAQWNLEDRTINIILTAYQKLIDNKELGVALEQPTLFKVHIVLTIIQMIEMLLKVSQGDSQQNRLRPLRHSKILIKDLNVLHPGILTTIVQQTYTLANFYLSTKEENELQEFLNYFERH